MYEPGAFCAERINISARCAAALIVLKAYVNDVPSFPGGTPFIESSPFELTKRTSGELYAVLST